MLTIKIAAALALSLFLSLAYHAWDELKEDHAALQNSLIEANSKLDAAEKLNKKEQEDRALLVAQKQEMENEAKKLRDCIDAGSCVATVSVLDEPACPSMPQVEGSPRAVVRQAQLAPAAARTRARLETELKELEALYSYCQRTLRSWASQVNEG